MKGPPEAARKSQFRLDAQPDLPARNLARVAGNEVVDGLVGVRRAMRGITPVASQVRRTMFRGWSAIFGGP